MGGAGVAATIPQRGAEAVTECRWPEKVHGRDRRRGSVVDRVRRALLVPVRMRVPSQCSARCAAALAWRNARGRKMPTHSPPAWRTLG